MRKISTPSLWQAAACFLSMVLGWTLGRPFEGTEFSHGQVTGPLLQTQEVGSLVLFAALSLTLFYRRASAALALIACLLCLPLCLSLVAPGLFRKVVGGLWSSGVTGTFVWSSRAMADTFVLAFTAMICLRNLLISSPESQGSN